MKRINYLLGVVAIALVSLLVAGCTAGAATPAAAQTKEPSGITVSGEGKALAVPDVAYINLGVQTTGDTAKAAMDENARKMSQVVDKIKALGVAERDIQTSGINLSPVYDYSRTERESVPPRIIGYQASNNVTVTVNDIKRAPEVLDGVVGVGANYVSGLQFGIKNDEVLRRQALTEAAKQAQDKAKTLADALGVKVTGIAAVHEEYSGSPGPMRAAAGIMMDSSEATPVMAGEMTITARVQVVFSIQ